jgi:hypothetical protein
MTEVFFLDGGDDISDIAHALKTSGIAVIGCMRTEAPKLRATVSNALGADGEDGFGVINLLLPLIHDGETWDTTVFFYDAVHTYRPGSSIALVNKALNAWIAGGQSEYFVYREA